MNRDAVDEDWFKPSTTFNVTQSDQGLKDMLSQRIPLQDSSQANEKINKRKKIGGNAITEGDIHDYIMEREEERLDKRDKRRRNEESHAITIEHDGLSVIITGDGMIAKMWSWYFVLYIPFRFRYSDMYKSC